MKPLPWGVVGKLAELPASQHCWSRQVPGILSLFSALTFIHVGLPTHDCRALENAALPEAGGLGLQKPGCGQGVGKGRSLDSGKGPW